MGKMISGKEVERIIKVYMETDSIIETAKACKISTVKARKVLITEGLWSSETSEQIRELLAQGRSTTEVAETLCMSVKNVQAYMPYARGTYGGNERTLEALRAETYRMRKRNAAMMQVAQNGEHSFSEQERRMMKKEKNLKEQGLGVVKLHLELNLEDALDEDIEVLKKYGSMEKSISRDILAPADITLHALHYAILRAFGWQNGHLHHFALPDEDFDRLTRESFMTWAHLVGVYFRFPSEDFRDIYWDDDYKETVGVRTWLARKYTGPYKYKGYGEHYLIAQEKVRDFIEDCPRIRVHEWNWNAEEKASSYEVALADASVREVQKAFFDMTCQELIERLRLSEVLGLSIAWPPVPDYALKIADEELAKFDYKQALEGYETGRFRNEKQRQEYLKQYNPSVLPVTQKLIYRYDYGDNWEVNITVEDVFLTTVDGEWTGFAKEGMQGISPEDLDTVAEKHRPLCIAKDGIELVDDVGGIHGFCNMLETIYDYDPLDEKSVREREMILSWASLMGWFGRKINPKQTL